MEQLPVAESSSSVEPVPASSVTTVKAVKKSKRTQQKLKNDYGNDPSVGRCSKCLAFYYIPKGHTCKLKHFVAAQKLTGVKVSHVTRKFFLSSRISSDLSDSQKAVLLGLINDHVICIHSAKLLASSLLQGVIINELQSLNSTTPSTAQLSDLTPHQGLASLNPSSRQQFDSCVRTTA